MAFHLIDSRLPSSLAKIPEHIRCSESKTIKHHGIDAMLDTWCQIDPTTRPDLDISTEWPLSSPPSSSPLGGQRQRPGPDLGLWVLRSSDPPRLG